MKELLWVLGFIILCVAGYLVVLKRDINSVDYFCSEMKAGLDVRSIASIADKYDVGSKNIHDPKSVDNETLGTKVNGSLGVWFFVVASPMTVGEHACGVYHNNKVVLSAKISG
jgi:hypothetical protein